MIQTDLSHLSGSLLKQQHKYPQPHFSATGEIAYSRHYGKSRGHHRQQWIGNLRQLTLVS